MIIFIGRVWLTGNNCFLLICSTYATIWALCEYYAGRFTTLDIITLTLISFFLSVLTSTCLRAGKAHRMCGENGAWSLVRNGTQTWVDYRGCEYLKEEELTKMIEEGDVSGQHGFIIIYLRYCLKTSNILLLFCVICCLLHSVSPQSMHDRFIVTSFNMHCYVEIHRSFMFVAENKVVDSLVHGGVLMFSRRSGVCCHDLGLFQVSYLRLLQDKRTKYFVIFCHFTKYNIPFMTWCFHPSLGVSCW